MTNTRPSAVDVLSAPSARNVLSAENISMQIGGLAILRAASLSVRSGEIVGLIGPNGAGKTTLLDIICGLTDPVDGEIRLHGERVKIRTDRRVAAGIARTYQDTRLFGRLSLLENVMIGALYGRERCRTIWMARRRAEAALDQVKLRHRSALRAGAASTGQQKLTSLARAVCMRPAVMILDEPLAALSASNQELALSIIRESASEGCGVVLVEHVMHAVFGTAEKIVVLDQGRVIFTGSPQEAAQDAAVVEAYLGSRSEEAREIWGGEDQWAK